MLETVLSYGTGRAAAIGQFAAGKTGTTSNYGDAWFVGWDSKYTVAVWVGYPTKLVPMTTEFNGGPVLGGTFPALIWHSFMMAALQIDKARGERGSAKKTTAREAAEAAGAPEGSGGTPSPGTSGKAASPSAPPAAKGNSSAPAASPNREGAGAEGKASEPASPAGTSPPAAQGTSTPAPAPATPPTSSSPSATGGVGPSG
jgi:penicillin-binding protein 1A